MLHERGIQLFNEDSDDNMSPAIPAFLEAGVDVMHPFEASAGMDIVQVRANYGNQLAMGGGIDKHVLRKRDYRRTGIQNPSPRAHWWLRARP